VWALGHNAPLIHLLILVLYILFACLHCLLPHLYFFFTLFLPYLFPCLSFTLRIDPIHFQARCRKRRLNLALVFVFILCCSTFLLIDECMLCCVRFSFSIPSHEIGLGNVSEMTYFMLSGT